MMYNVDSGLSCDVDLEQCLTAVSYAVLLTSDSLTDLESCGWGLKNSLLEGVGPMPIEGFAGP